MVCIKQQVIIIIKKKRQKKGKNLHRKEISVLSFWLFVFVGKKTKQNIYIYCMSPCFFFKF
jgi:hypothetical protein